MLDFLDFMNVMLFLFIIISGPLFLLPLIFAIIGFFRKNELKAAITLSGYFFAFLFGKIIGFDESFILLIMVYTFFFLSWYLEKIGYKPLRTIIFLSITILCYLGIVILFNAPYGKITPAGNAITEQQLVEEIKLLASKKINIRSVEVWENGQHPNVKVHSVYPHGKIIRLDASIKHDRDNFTEPFEVQEAMKILLYVKERNLPFKVVGVHVSVSPKWVIAQIPQVLISTTEFEEIYHSFDVNQLNENEQVQRLSKLWIKKHEPPKHQPEIK